MSAVDGPPVRLTVVFAPDSFKGSLSSVEVARALAEGWREPLGDELLLAPSLMAVKNLAAIDAAGGWRRHDASVHDPLGRPIVARWLRSEDGERGIVELAEASGLVTPGRRRAGCDPREHGRDRRGHSGRYRLQASIA